MPVDPAGFSKIKVVLTDSVGSVYPGIEANIDFGSFSQDALNDVADQIYDATADNIMPHINARWTLTSLRVLYSDGSVVWLGEKVGTTAGSFGTSSDGTRNDCVVSGYQIASYYRGGKPRTYWPGTWRLEPGSITRWRADAIADFQDAVNLWLTEISTITPPDLDAILPGCIRRTGSGITTPQFFPYIAAHVDTRVCSQRRRVPR